MKSQLYQKVDINKTKKPRLVTRPNLEFGIKKFKLSPEEKEYLTIISSIQISYYNLSIEERIRRLEEKARSKEELIELLDKTRGRSIEKGHNAALDLLSYLVEFEDIPRALTLLVASGTYEGVMQASTRRISHKRVLNVSSFLERYYKGINMELLRKVDEIIDKEMNLYLNPLENMDKSDKKRYKEVFMYIAPLSLLTQININGDVRTLTEIYLIEKNKKYLGEEYGNNLWSFLKEINPYLFRDHGFNMEEKERVPWPGESLFMEYYQIGRYKEGKFVPKVIVKEGLEDDNGELEDIVNRMFKGDPSALIKSRNIKIGITFLTDLSLWHQWLRHRSVEKEIASIDEPLKQRNIEDYFLDPKVPKENEKWKEDYWKTIEEVVKLYRDLRNSNVSIIDASLILPHSLKLPLTLHLDLWNAMKMFGERLCLTAKESMRVEANSIRKILNNYKDSLKNEKERFVINLFLKAMVPKCVALDQCPEGLYPDKCRLKDIYSAPTGI